MQQPSGFVMLRLFNLCHVGTGCSPLVGVKVCQYVETTALLAESLWYAILDQGPHLQVVLAYSVPLIILFLL